MQGLPVGLYSGTPEGGFPTFPRSAGTRSGIIGGALEVRGLCLHTRHAAVLRAGASEAVRTPQ
jgi:hypothetical protein